MTYLIVLAIYTSILFAIAWLSRRSLGTATLALAAGALLANLWTESLTPIVAQSGLVLVQPPLASIVAIALTLLPALLIVFRLPKPASPHHGLISALVFAILAATLTYGPFSNAVVLDDASQQIVRTLVSYQNIIITIGVIYGVLEVVWHHTPKAHTGGKGKHHK